VCLGNSLIHEQKRGLDACLSGSKWQTRAEHLALLWVVPEGLRHIHKEHGHTSGSSSRGAELNPWLATMVRREGSRMSHEAERPELFIES